MTNLTWRVTRLIKNNSNDYVIAVGCKIIVSDGSFTLEAGEFLAPLTGEATIPLDLLTEDTCVEWAKNALGEGEAQREEADALQRFQAKFYPPTSDVLPWATSGSL